MNSFKIPISAQVKNQLLQKKGELSELKAEIKQLENQLLNKTQNEQKSIEVIENFNKQKFLLNKIINTIRNEERNKEKQIINIELQIKSIETKIKKLKDNYSKYVVYLYKYGKQDELAMILGSESFNQALLRYKYLNKISEQRKRDLSELKDNQTELGEARIFLTNELEQKKIIADQKQAEQEELKLKIEKRRTYLASLKNDKQAIKDEIDLKRKSEDGIKRIIANLIAEEKRKAEALKRERELAKRKPKSELKTEKAPLVETDYTQNLSSFAALKGMLKWPVDNGKIIRKFGEQKNARLNTVTLNYGVDIKTAKDKTIKAVADGIVSSVNWLPGYGTVLIISHKDEYRTVYGHLSEIFVSEGTQVLSGASIGTVEESLEGNILHFEIWSERVNQNPEVWLR